MTKEIPQYKIAQFNSKHDVTEDQQFKALVEEVGELSEALNRYETDTIAEELADVVFVARSLAELHDINISTEVVDTITENLQKDTATDGSKVTKATSSPQNNLLTEPSMNGKYSVGD